MGRTPKSIDHPPCSALTIRTTPSSHSTESEENSDVEMTTHTLSLQTQIDRLVAVLKYKDQQLAEKEQSIQSLTEQLSQKDSKEKEQTAKGVYLHVSGPSERIEEPSALTQRVEELETILEEMGNENEALRVQNESNHQVIKIILQSQAEQLRYFENLRKHKTLYPLQNEMCEKMLGECRNDKGTDQDHDHNASNGNESEVTDHDMDKGNDLDQTKCNDRDQTKGNELQWDHTNGDDLDWDQPLLESNNPVRSDKGDNASKRSDESDSASSDACWDSLLNDS